MKLLAILLTFFSFSLAGYSQSCCPPGSTEYRDTTYFVDSLGVTTTCEIEITYCLSTPPTGFVDIKLCEITFLNPLDSTCQIDLSEPYFWQWAERVILDHASTVYTFPPCSESPGPFAYTAKVEKAECWGMVDDLANLIVRIVPCDADAGTCITYYKYCYDNTGTLVKEFVTKELFSQGGCDLAYPDPIFVIFGNTYPCWSSCW